MRRESLLCCANNPLGLARENTNAREESDERDEHSDITGSHLDLL